ncbi:GDP-L-fucose synthase [Sinorhizobium saheli]|uniref:GDP-L-fucose synthase n=1 Tax=Sinorhizobium saheli TaxID=36856 RepID=A0A178XX20_SINSA|nr:GDP-L-fucose synthase [Sinorhizobium saheli]MQW86353.1 NAD-dependent epimerase/dehydratase family protein [Sinorhizobium saheli]OAP39706.1 GDP-fucose synthetase [Sinorhizobium saheli]
MYSLSGKRVWVAGHRGMVGSAITRSLATEDCEIIVADRQKLDLTRQEDVQQFLLKEKPHAVVMAAAKVGGILANDTMPADFIYQNLVMEANVIEASFRNGVEKLLFLGSSCIYPKYASQPIREEALLTGSLESTNEWYAIAKIAGVKLCQAYRKQYRADFISVMPTNLYGPHDNFDLVTSHVVPALIRKAHDAKIRNFDRLRIWGSGTPRREFLYSEDCADAAVFLLKHYSEAEHINIGFGSDITIIELARLVCDVVGFKGDIELDTSKPDGTPRKLLSSEKLLSMGWRPKTSIEVGLARSYEWFISNVVDNPR